MNPFATARNKILEPVHNTAAIAICAIVIAIVALIAAVRH